MIQPLAPAYLEKLEELANEIQNSEELNTYLETEELDDFNRLKELYEPRISMLLDDVASNNPLQLVSFEQTLLHPSFEGLYLPKILGYSVLRGEVDERYKYVHPQNHFKAILMAVCNSANFDILRMRIGQSIQMGFALSSDIWITNLISEIQNKRIRYFLQGQKLEKYRREKERSIFYNRYKRQFRNDQYQSAEFPDDKSSLKVLFSSLKQFLLHRISVDKDDSSIIPHLNSFIEHADFQQTDELLEVLTMYAKFFERGEEDQEKLMSVFNRTRTEMPEFVGKYFEFLLELHLDKRSKLDGTADAYMSATLDKDIADDLTKYYNLMDVIHNQGYHTPEAQEAVKNFYVQYEGLSTINECARQSILRYFRKYIQNLEPEDYSSYFEITKVFTIYMSIFANQQFNQSLKDLSMAYIRKLLKTFTDKRGKDYQDVKKFVSTSFVDFGFLKPKEVVELFKTRRKRRKKPETPSS
ncbi:MAG: hypothetical protein AB8G22_08530 [Saprospiraceae bacterium]